MTCPICDNKSANCDCTSTEKDQHERIEELEEEIEKLKGEIMSKPRPHKFVAMAAEHSVTVYCEYCGHVSFSGNRCTNRARQKQAENGCPLAPDERKDDNHEQT
jgi:hypothetical protein